MLNENLYCLILAGGTGTRLWPLSRKSFPKQFLRINGDESLLVLTLKRAVGIVPAKNIFVVLEEKQRSLLEEDIRSTDFFGEVEILTEPVGKNTAPAILLGALEIYSRNKDAVIMVFPSDHILDVEGSFHDHISRAVSIAEDDYLVSFGITPFSPETGYGYIEGGEALSRGALKIKRFVEKPSREIASEYLRSGNFFWNSGMFVFRAEVIIREYATYCPEVYEPVKKAFQKAIIQDVYAELPSVQFDRAIMEKTHRAAVIPSSFPWSDIGSWRLLYEFLPKDSKDNVISGDVIISDTEGSLVKSGSRLVCVSGLRNAAVIETEDAVFVSDIHSSHKAGEFAEELKKKDRKEASWSPSVGRFRGARKEIEKEESSSTAKITLPPGKSYTFENDFSNYVILVVVRGKALVVYENSARELATGQSLLFKNGENWVVENKEDQVLNLLEIVSFQT